MASADFRLVGPAPENAILRLREVGKVLDDPEKIGSENEHVLRPLKDLSAIAKSLDCTVVFREVGNSRHVPATIDASSCPPIAQSLYPLPARLRKVTVDVKGGRCADIRRSSQPSKSVAV